MNITWEGVLAIMSVVGFFGGFVAWYVRQQFKGFAEELMVRLDERYVTRKECQLITHVMETKQ